MFKAKSVGNCVILHINNHEESVLQTTKATKSPLFLVKHLFFHLLYNFRDYMYIHCRIVYQHMHIIMITNL